MLLQLNQNRSFNAENKLGSFPVLNPSVVTSKGKLLQCWQPTMYCLSKYKMFNFFMYSIDLFIIVTNFTLNDNPINMNNLVSSSLIEKYLIVIFIEGYTHH